MPYFIHLIGSYPLLILALGVTSAAIMLRPHSPPQLLPDLLGCFAALLLFAPAVEAVRKMQAAKSKDAEKTKKARA